MSEVGAKLSKHKIDIFILLVIFLLGGILRFYNLGYSNYTADEYGAMFWTKSTESNFPDDPIDFFLTRKKGPLQYLVSIVPIFLTGEFNNEFALRLPFAIASVLSLGVFYLLIRRLTKSRWVGFISTILLMSTGFVAAFGRIAQYQNLNLLFSFSALYLYSELLVSKKNLLRKTLFGTISLSLSVLAHWDAIYVLPPAFLIMHSFLRNKEFKKELKKKIVFSNIALGLFVTLPFILPYFLSSAGGGDGISYLVRRFGYQFGSNIENYIFDIEFYNPFLSLYIYLIGGFLGALFVKKSKFFLVWFLVNFAFFEFFIKEPGTHIYNFMIPLFVLVAIGLNEFIQRSLRNFRAGAVVFVMSLLAFLYYQTFAIYVDHTLEYPWEQEKILGHKTVKHSHKHRPRYLLGFPHNRYWEEINDFVNAQNKQNGENFGYLTNESKTISGYYMDVTYQSTGGFYAIGIKKPWSFSNDAKFPQIRGKHTVHRIEDEFGEKVVRIYRVDHR